MMPRRVVWAGPWLAVILLFVRPTHATLVSASFEISSEEDGAVHERGRFHFDERGAWRVDTAHPTEQSFVSTDTLTVILYPKEARAFRIRTGLLEPPTHLFFFAHSFATNEQLTAMGLTMADFASQGDTTVTTWKTMGSVAPDAAGHLELRRVGPALVRFDLHHLDGRVSRYDILSRSDGTPPLPTDVEMTRWNEDTLERERIRYFDFQIDDEPTGLLQPQVPEGFTVEDRAW